MNLQTLQEEADKLAWKHARRGAPHELCTDIKNLLSQAWHASREALVEELEGKRIKYEYKEGRLTDASEIEYVKGHNRGIQTAIDLSRKGKGV